MTLCSPSPSVKSKTKPFKLFFIGHINHFNFVHWFPLINFFISFSCYPLSLKILEFLERTVWWGFSSFLTAWGRCLDLFLACPWLPLSKYLIERQYVVLESSQADVTWVPHLLIMSCMASDKSLYNPKTHCHFLEKGKSILICQSFSVRDSSTFSIRQ